MWGDEPQAPSRQSRDTIRKYGIQDDSVILLVERMVLLQTTAQARRVPMTGGLDLNKRRHSNITVGPGSVGFVVLTPVKPLEGIPCPNNRRQAPMEAGPAGVQLEVQPRHGVSRYPGSGSPGSHEPIPIESNFA